MGKHVHGLKRHLTIGDRRAVFFDRHDAWPAAASGMRNIRCRIQIEQRDAGERRRHEPHEDVRREHVG